uniref:AAA+ ATPase domain-containing protein n=1 Tax=Oryza glumipatula TaxID=40148 RepID=A0A0E0AJ70_9ORYZ
MQPALLTSIPNIALLLGTLTAEQISRVRRVKDEVTKLKRQFEQMLDIIKELEQMNHHDAKTKHWMRQLRDYVYRTEDIIDLYRIDAERRKAIESAEKLERHIKLLLSCPKGVSVGCRVSSSIHKLNLDIEKISRESSTLQRRYSAMHNQLIGSLSDTIPYHESNIVGCGVADNTRKLVKLIRTTSDQGTIVFAIAGTVGIGKTTLARQIYHNREMLQAFDLQLWVCVNKDADYLTLLKKIITAAGGNSSGLDHSREKLESKLNSSIKERRFFLVLDDVWDETTWENMLENQLQCAAPGSRILMTTRHKHVAKRMGAVHIHHVNRLRGEDGWDLLRSRARLDKDEETVYMQAIGRKIVERCDGLPMVIKAVGGVLRCCEPTCNEWQNVCDSIFSVLPDDVQALIRLSYIDLPSPLKRCFLYCSLFPADFVIRRRYVTQQWVSEGFIEATHNSALEEVAEEHYRVLIERSLLQPELGLDGEDGARMPNIFRWLAKELSREENFSGDLGNMQSPFEPRRLSFASQPVETVPQGIKKLTHLRTLLFFENRNLDSNGHGLGRTFRRLTLLRVLDLHSSNVEHVPNALGNVVHLRYLNLSRTRVRELPDSITNLRLLQFLILNDCEDLNYLPRGVEQLRNLRSLEISGHNNLRHPKISLGRLCELSCMRGFLVKAAAIEGNQFNASGWPLTELSSVSKLTSLQILRLERATRVDALESALSQKVNLRELELCCVNEQDNQEFAIRDVFEVLCPAPRLVVLKLQKYFGQEYPSWIAESKLPNLQCLELQGCSCKRLPALGELPQLRSLVLIDLKNLDIVGSELRGRLHANKAAFPRLEKLDFNGLDILLSWIDLQDSDLPFLRSVRFVRCWKLESVPSVIWSRTKLGNINIDECPDLRWSSNGSD